MTEILGIIEARDQLPDLVRRVKETPGVALAIGRYRRPEATLMASAMAVPPAMRSKLLGTFWCYEADQALREKSAERGNFLHAGDPVGAVLAWLWRTDQDAAIEALATYVSELRFHSPTRLAHAARIRGLEWPEVDPVSLEDVLTALRPAMPADFERRELDALCERARTEVRKWLGDSAD